MLSSGTSSLVKMWLWQTKQPLSQKVKSKCRPQWRCWKLWPFSGRYCPGQRAVCPAGQLVGDSLGSKGQVSTDASIASIVFLEIFLLSIELNCASEQTLLFLFYFLWLLLIILFCFLFIGITVIVGRAIQLVHRCSYVIFAIARHRFCCSCKVGAELFFFLPWQDFGNLQQLQLT